ncbi:MAG: site-specific integrase [Beduini sp.]
MKNVNAIMLGLYAGLRLGEVCALKWEDIDLEEGVIHINKTVQRLENINRQLTKTQVMIFKPKTQSSYRDVMMPDFLTEYIKKYFALVLLNHNSENHFILSNKTTPSEPRIIQRSFERVCKESGIMTNFHTLRHTYAANCIKLSIDVKTVSEMLGHSNISTTLNRYVHPSLKLKKLKSIN